MVFNDRRGKLIWSIPFIEGGVGRTKPPHELHIQVEITPGDQLVGRIVAFLNKATIDATDQFVDQVISGLIDTFPSTDTAAVGQGTVE